MVAGFCIIEELAQAERKSISTCQILEVVVHSQVVVSKFSLRVPVRRLKRNMRTFIIVGRHEITSKPVISQYLRSGKKDGGASIEKSA